MDLGDRIATVRRQMEAEGIETLIAASDARHMLDLPDPVTHLSGFRALGESLAVLRRDGPVTLLLTPAWDVERAVLRCPDAAAIGTDDLAAGLARLGTPGQVATAGMAALPHRLAARLGAVIGAAAPAWDRMLYAVSARKTAAEIARARHAAGIAEKGFMRLLTLARPGLRECDLAIAVNGRMKSLGADDNFLMLNAQPHNPAVMPSSTRPLAVGDILLTELTPSYEGQFAQICRTAVIGAASAELQEKYALVVGAMAAGIDAIRPGVPLATVCHAIDRVLAGAGYGDYCRPPHIRRRGHGLGCGSTAPGDVATDNDMRLEEDMIFVVHPNQYLPETGYLMCGEPVRVTADGVERLSVRPAALAVIPA